MKESVLSDLNMTRFTNQTEPVLTNFDSSPRKHNSAMKNATGPRFSLAASGKKKKKQLDIPKLDFDRLNQTTVVDPSYNKESQTPQV